MSGRRRIILLRVSSQPGNHEDRPHTALFYAILYVMTKPYQSIITLQPGQRSGKPIIRGMRTTVYDMLSYLAAGMAVQKILADFPYLTAEVIQACLSYAAARERQVVVACA